MISLLFLSILYGVASIVYLCDSFRSIVRSGEIRIIHCLKLMYAFVYGLLPMLIYYREYRGERNLAYYNYSGEGIFTLYFFMLFSIAGYAIICLIYAHFYYRKTAFLEQDSTYEMMQLNDQKFKYNNYVFICGLLTMAVGWIGLVLWTRAYGSISNFILNANAIRSGRGGVANSLAFMKQFAKVLPISLYALIASFIVRRPHGLKKIGHFLSIILSLIGTYLYLLASDSRVTIAFCGIGIILIIIRHRKGKNIRKYILLACLIAVLLLVATMSADMITNYARYHIWVTSENGFVDSIIDEFRFIGTTQAYVLDNLFSRNLKLKVLDDWINALTSWFPERFIPFSLPMTVWTYNTMNISGSTLGGTVPSDMLSTGIYHLNVIGLFVVPAIYGYFAAVADSKIRRYGNSVYTDPYYGVLVGLFIQCVSHNQLSTFVASMFPMFVYYLIGYFVRSFNLSREVYTEDE